MQKYSSTPEVSQPSQSSARVTGGIITPRAWFEQWPDERRSGLANLFHEATRAGQKTPDLVVQHVQQAVHRGLQWSTDPERRAHCHHVLTALTDDRPGVLAYAASLLAWEALPYAEHQRQKQERTANYQQAYMTTLPPTQRQLAFLKNLRDTGPAPAHRAEASAGIDTLLYARGKEV